MDKLIRYIETRIKRYGHVQSEQALTSNYYTFSKGTIRISDHVKYGLSEQNGFDYSFIIQPNDMYIFSVTPKNNTLDSSKMYFKIITLKEAKQFIKKLHDFSLSFDYMNDIYHPEGWNRGNTPADKPSWLDFCNTYINVLDEDCKKLNVLDHIERIKTGKNSKGNVQSKMNRMSEMYESLTITQYDTLLTKLKK